MLQQIDLAAREDSAQYKPNPWSIARVNAASRSRQPNATVIPVAEKSSTKKLPQGAIVDAFKRQAQKPSSTAKNSSTQPNRLPVLQKNPTCSSFNAAPDNLVLVSSCSHTSTAHIVTSAVNPVPIPLQSPTIMEQRRSPPPSSFLPRRAPSTHIDQLFTRSPNPSFTPNLKRTFPFSSPGPPPPNLRYDISGKRPTLSQIPVHFRPHTSQPQTTHNNNNNNEHAVTDPITRTAPVCQGNKTLMHPPQPFHHPAPVNLERTTVSPHPHYTSHLPPHLQLDRPIIKSSPKSQEIHPTPSFAQARRFFEYSSLPVTAVGDPSPELRPLRESRHPTSPPPSLRIPSPPRKDTNPYDQLPPSPDSEWSTLKPQTRAAKAKAKPKVPDAKSGKFRLPLSLGSVTPKEPAQQIPRVITYLPPPPPKKRKIGTESYSRTSDVEPDVCTDDIFLLVDNLFLLLTFCFPFLQRSKRRGPGRGGCIPRRHLTKRLHQARPRHPCSSIQTACPAATRLSVQRSVR